MIYPSVLIVIAVGAVIALFMFVLPGIFSIVEQFDNLELPLVTRILKQMSDFLILYWYPMLVSIGFVLGGTVVFFSTQQGQKTLTQIIMMIPIIGKMTKYYYLIKFCRYTKIMITAGMNYVDTFTMLKGILAIPAYDTILDGISS
jgi:type IV pilus assembly protein PilC